MGVKKLETCICTKKKAAYGRDNPYCLFPHGEKYWTANEERWIAKAQELLQRKPTTVKLYTIDGEIVACKRGVSSYDLCTMVAAAGIIDGGAMLTDIHDEITDCGRR